ncbi:MAG TPA: thiosulfate oxidation carrier protein SoxY [Hyphomicrobiaceae bacterium]|nr:thiosulfate oxidation carrier protein SoxY [Hyphomicrobiaceae bacterium]
MVRRSAGGKVSVIGRRDVLLGAGAATLVAALLSGAKGAAAQDKPNGWEDIVKKLMGDAKPVDGKIAIDLPEIAESGNTVPFTVTVDSPMTDASHVKSVSILSTKNPSPLIGTFHFAPEAGKASITSRMRLAGTQDVVTLAAMSDGRFIMSKRMIKVTIGGCGG